MLLQAGPITVLYENGFLRYINYGASEVVRMIYFALRDENWGTFDTIIKNETIHTKQNHFRVNYDCYHQKDGVAVFYWEVTICGYEDGKITFEIDGKALTGFLKNRLGFCVLHPFGNYTGQSVKITHPDGAITGTKFPEFIAAENPFTEIKALNWQKDNIWYKIDFEGDVFETEDQRNWTDASFKTFCTPLKLPFPAAVSKGAVIRQKITFSPKEDLPHLLTGYGEKNIIAIQSKSHLLPEIGIGACTEITALPGKAINLLRSLSLSYYSITVEPLKRNWTSIFFRENETAKALQLPLRVSLQLSDDFINEITVFIAVCTQIKAVVKAITILSKGQQVTGQKLADYIVEIQLQLPGVLIGAGADFNFTEINRNRFKAGNVQFISYGIHPQEHVFDDLSLIENIQAQAETVKSTKNIYGNSMPVVIDALTLRKRFNPYATDPAAVIKSNKERADPRQQTKFCALFTLGSIKSLAMADTAGITCFQTVGNQGILSETGEPFPVYDALKLVLNKSLKQIIATSSDNPLVVDSILFGDNTMLLWNYTNKSQVALLPDGNEIKLSPLQVKTIAINA